MTNATATKREYRKMAPMQMQPRCLFPADVPLLIAWERAKAEVKRLEEYLKPKLQATIDKHGTGTLVLGIHTVELSQSSRAAVSWKQLCESVAPAEVIERVKPDYTTNFEIVSARVLS